MKYILFTFLFLPFLSFAQIDQGDVFKRLPTTPTEDIRLTGVIEVTKTMYGLTFKDLTISENYKKAVKRFFKQSLNGYSDLKKYRLNIEKRTDGLYIENQKILIN